MIYPNLCAEMARRGITRSDLATSIGRTASTMSQKLNGFAPITLDEAKTIKNTLQTDLALETLFQRSE